HRLKWPDDAESIKSAYASPDQFRTRVLGGADSIKHLANLKQLRVDVIPFGGAQVPEFLAGVGFWVYMHSQDLVESFGMAIVEVMASGCVAILPPYMEPL